MSKKFTLSPLFDRHALTILVQNYGFRRMSEQEIEHEIQRAFSDYILSALSELGSDTGSNNKIYIEALFYLEKSKKLLADMPHPVGKMAYRLGNMASTLNKLIEGKDNFAAERATRFMEKNLARRLRDLWVSNTSTPFHAGGDDSGKNPRDFILECFSAAGEQYPEISWFKEVDVKITDMLIKSIKK